MMVCTRDKGQLERGYILSPAMAVLRRGRRGMTMNFIFYGGKTMYVDLYWAN